MALILDWIDSWMILSDMSHLTDGCPIPKLLTKTEYSPRKDEEKPSGTENLQAIISYIFSLVALTCLLQVF